MLRKGEQRTPFIVELPVDPANLVVLAVGIVVAALRAPALVACQQQEAATPAEVEREREVASALARGLSNAEIAAELFMGVPTVKTHVGRIFDKLGVENRVQIAILVHDATR